MNKKVTAGILAGVVAAVAIGAAVPTFARGEGGMHFGGPRINFTELDANGDGKITRDEFEARRAAEFAATDADGDGNISREELVAHIVARATDRAEGMADRMMEHRDANADGVLSADEMAGDDRQQARLDRMFERFDDDGDGALSQAELDDIGMMGRFMHRRGHDQSDN